MPRCRGPLSRRQRRRRGWKWGGIPSPADWEVGSKNGFDILLQVQELLQSYRIFLQDRQRRDFAD